MDKRLPELYYAVSTARTRWDYQRCLSAFAENAGFERYSAIAVAERLDGSFVFDSIDNMPEPYRNGNGTAEDARTVDPVMQHCRRSALPIAYGQQTYVSQGVGHHWEEQASYGYRTGISLATHMPGGRHFVFGVDGTALHLPKGMECARLIGAIQLFAAYACEGIGGVDHLGQTVDVALLSERELEMLRWVAEGKSAWDTSQIVRLSERMVHKHIQSSMAKLGAANKHQALARARQLGLVKC